MQHRNTGCIIKCHSFNNTLSGTCRGNQALAHGGLSSLKKSLFQSHRFSEDVVNNVVCTAHRLLKHWIIIQLWSVSRWTIGHVLVLPLNWKEEKDQHAAAGYIRDRTLRCCRCFILLTQLGKQPTLALSIEAHRLQHDPDSSAHTRASDKGSHCAIGDGVKTVIHDNVSSGGDIQSARLNCNMLSAHSHTTSDIALS